MRKIVYYVASSLDGFIAGTNEDISGFVYEGKGVDQYLQDLQSFDTTIMGRKTYEFGYRFGLTPGALAYPHMKHYIFSNSLVLDNADPKIEICPLSIRKILDIKEDQGTDIYLCGGGQFAGWLLKHQLIDILKIKLNPLILGDGIPLFGETKQTNQLKLIAKQSFDNNIELLTYQIIY